MIKKGLPDDVITMIQDLLDKPVDQLDAYEREVLRSRKDYLTKAEKIALGKVMTEKPSEEDRKIIMDRLINGTPTKNET